MAAYGLLLLVFLALAAWGSRAPGNSAARDTDLVYCLDPAHRDGLVNAAVSLGLAGAGAAPGMLNVAGHDLSLATWRKTHDSDFQRACHAYSAASRPAPPAAAVNTGTGPVLAVLLPVIAGALLTMAADDFKQLSSRRWAQADELRYDFQEFETAARSFVRARASPLNRGGPSLAELDAKRRALAATLRKIHAQHRKSPTIRTLQDNLAGVLGTSIASGWDGEGAAGAGMRAKQITDCLGTFGSSLEKVAGALERRVWLSSKL